MLPVLAQIGPVTVYTYAALLNLGLVGTLIWLYGRAPAEHKTAWLDLGLAALAGGLIGARASYVAANLSYFAAQPLEALQLWQGGLGWPGAAAGALLGAGWLARRRGLPLRPVLDALAGPITVLSALAWGGCYAAGCAYGAVVTPGAAPAWLTPSTPDLFGVSAARWPTQLAGAAWGLISLFLVWDNRGRRWPAGAAGLYALSLTALGAFLIDFGRGDPLPLVAGYRLDVVGSALVLVPATLVWALWVLRPAGRLTPSASTGEPDDLSRPGPGPDQNPAG